MLPRFAYQVLQVIRHESFMTSLNFLRYCIMLGAVLIFLTKELGIKSE